MAKKVKSGCDCCGCVFLDDWFYLILLILVGVALLCFNLGWLDAVWIAYWPLLLILIGVKELLERN